MRPLADKMRPNNLEGFLGQEGLIGKGKMLSMAIAQDKIPSMIFWGPPGSGKTTLALIIAKQTKSEFKQLSAVNSGKKDLQNIIEEAKMNERLGKKTILFVDEIHRWNKAQQDGLLPYVERGEVTFIGSTTENPSFEVISALLSRCRVFVLKPLEEEHLKALIKNALKDKESGLGNLKIKMSSTAISLLAKMADGDARRALNVLEYSAGLSAEITKEIIKEAFQKSHLMYDKAGEEHYNIISALHKSMRGSNANAALYWLARMLEAGEEPLYIARRLIRFASEDIGVANSLALVQAVATYHACHFIGMPECNVVLAQCVVYMAKSKKSNELYLAYEMAKKDVEGLGNLPVPLHLRNAPTKLMKELGYSKGYKYSPKYAYEEEQQYLPDKLKNRKYFKT